jgi:predicted nucleic acid-binding protein
MPSLVLDVSVTISALIEEYQSDEARGILETIARDGAMVPPLWSLEVGHILLRAERRGLLDAVTRRAHLRHLSRLPIAVDHEMAGHAWHDTMALAERHGLALYDATYLELSLRRGLPLATFDAALRRAATAAGADLL